MSSQHAAGEQPLSERPLRIVVYGAGAVGGHLAVRFARAGANVSVIARGAHGAAIRERGLTLLRGSEVEHADLPCTDDPATLGPQDVVIVAVKQTGLSAIAGKLAALVGPTTRVVFAMNGIPWWFGDGLEVPLPAATRERLDPGNALRDAIPTDRVVGCAVYSGNVVDKPGTVRNTTPERNRMILGTPSGARDPHLDAFAALARQAGIDAVVTPGIREALWIKMQLIVAGSPVSALTRSPLDRVVGDPALRTIVAAIFEESRQLGLALGFAVPDDTNERIEFYRHRAIRPSMLQDLEAHKPLEVDNGILAFRDIAHAAGHVVPAMDMVAALVGGLARKLAEPAT